MGSDVFFYFLFVVMLPLRRPDTSLHGAPRFRPWNDAEPGDCVAASIDMHAPLRGTAWCVKSEREKKRERDAFRVVGKKELLAHSNAPSLPPFASINSSKQRLGEVALHRRKETEPPEGKGIIITFIYYHNYYVRNYYIF